MSVPVDHLHGSGPRRARVGPWRLQAPIGEGGMGVVHLAAGPDGRRVALKVLRPHVVSDAESRERLAREVALLRRVRSPRVAEVIDADPWDEVPWVATRYVPGWSLHEHVHAEGPLVGRDLRWFARCLAEALAAVHGTGVVHRDVKPANVLLEGRSPVLIDFGLARLADDSRLTRAGFLMGTPGYLAPEVLMGAEATPAADVHAFGACVAYAASGRAPFGSGPAVAVMDRVRRGEHDLSGLDAGIRPMVTACLDPDPVRRPDAATLVAALQAVPDTDAAAHEPVRAPRRAGSPATSAAAEPGPEPGPTVPLALGAASRHDRSGPRATRSLTALLRTGVGDRPSGRVGPATRAVSSTTTSRARAGEPRTTRMPVPPRSRQGPRPMPAPAQRQRPGPVEQQGPAPSRAPYAARPPGRAEVGAVAAAVRVGLAAVVVCLVLVAPWVGLAATLLAVHGLRTWSWTAQARREKVWRRGGSRWHDGPVALIGVPWYAVVALGGTGLLAVWAATVVGYVAGVATLAGVPGAATLAGSAGALVLACLTGPGSRRVRTATRRGSRRVASSRGAALLTLTALVVVVAVLASTAAAGPTWVPLGPPGDLLP